MDNQREKELEKRKQRIEERRALRLAQKANQPHAKEEHTRNSSFKKKTSFKKSEKEINAHEDEVPQEQKFAFKDAISFKNNYQNVKSGTFFKSRRMTLTETTLPKLAILDPSSKE